MDINISFPIGGVVQPNIISVWYTMLAEYPRKQLHYIHCGECGCFFSIYVNEFEIIVILFAWAFVSRTTQFTYTCNVLNCDVKECDMTLTPTRAVIRFKSGVRSKFNMLQKGYIWVLFLHDWCEWVSSPISFACFLHLRTFTLLLYSANTNVCWALD